MADTPPRPRAAGARYRRRSAVARTGGGRERAVADADHGAGRAGRAGRPVHRAGRAAGRHPEPADAPAGRTHRRRVPAARPGRHGPHRGGRGGRRHGHLGRAGRRARPGGRPDPDAGAGRPYRDRRGRTAPGSAPAARPLHDPLPARNGVRRRAGGRASGGRPGGHRDPAARPGGRCPHGRAAVPAVHPHGVRPCPGAGGAGRPARSADAGRPRRAGAARGRSCLRAPRGHRRPGRRAGDARAVLRRDAAPPVSRAGR